MLVGFLRMAETTVVPNIDSLWSVGLSRACYSNHCNTLMVHTDSQRRSTKVEIYVEVTDTDVPISAAEAWIEGEKIDHLKKHRFLTLRRRVFSYLCGSSSISA